VAGHAVHIARESRAFVISPSHFQARLVRTQKTSRSATRSRGWAPWPRRLAILGPDGSYLAGPLYDEEGILYADLDPQRLAEERQRFDPAGHYHRPDVLQLQVRPLGEQCEPVTLVDARTSPLRVPNISKEELVELVRRWAEGTGAHALIVFDGHPPSTTAARQ